MITFENMVSTTNCSSVDAVVDSRLFLDVENEFKFFGIRIAYAWSVQ